MLLLAGLIVTWTAVTVVCGQNISEKYQITEGQPHPDFLYPRIDNGEQVALSQFRGKKVLLIHFASW